MTLQDIKETKCYGHTFGRSFVRSDNVKTVYPPTNTVCGGYKYITIENTIFKISSWVSTSENLTFGNFVLQTKEQNF